MPFEMSFGQPPCGYALTAAKQNESAQVQYMEFTSTEDGQHFIQRLEGFPGEIISKLPNRTLPSMIDNLLAVIRSDGTATVYVNELKMTVRTRARRTIQAGDAVMKSDIVDVDRVDLGVPISADEGFLLVFSIGWRKGLFYDFGPLSPQSPEPREYDIPSTLGQYYCHLFFQERFSISDVEWKTLFDFKWFPFAGLPFDEVERLLSYIRTGWNPDELIPEFETSIKARTSDWLQSWQRRSTFQTHIPFLERAVERFVAQDYVSAVSILYSQIEGILRTYHRNLGQQVTPSQKNMPTTAVSSKINNPKSLLLPHRFEEYLAQVYFANFNTSDTDIEVGRNSVAHGVVKAQLFDPKAAIIGLLIVHQLFYFLEDGSSDSASSGAVGNG